MATAEDAITPLTEVSPARLAWMYEKMFTIRLFEEEIKNLYKRDMVRGSTHLYLGEEAVAVGACEPLRDGDYIVSTHRGHGHCIAKGGEVNRMMAELLGRVTGYCRGKGGSMHIADVSLGILGANGIVGGGIPIAPGAGLSCKRRGQKQVVLCFFGDAACNQGAFHESINLAAAWKLPVIYLCENNLYGVSTRLDEAAGVVDLALRAPGYGVPGYSIDGNDVMRVRKTVGEAVARARAGEGPSFIEAKTYRWEGHFVGDPCVYRTKEEVAAWKEQDPIRRFEEALTRERVFDADRLAAIRAEVARAIAAAVAFAEASPEPGPEDLMTDVYGNWSTGRYGA